MLVITKTYIYIYIYIYSITKTTTIHISSSHHLMICILQKMYLIYCDQTNKKNKPYSILNANMWHCSGVRVR